MNRPPAQLLPLWIGLLLFPSACSSDPDKDGLARDEEEAHGTDPKNPDTDGDGLSDGEEVNDLGTNPLASDTDGDGYSDSAELAAGSDPTDGFNWPEGDCNWPDFSDEAAADGITETGWAFGDTIPNFEVIDRHEQTLNLYQYYGFVIVLDISAGWCNPCRAVAGGAEDFYQEFKAQGFTLIHIMLHGNDDGIPSDAQFLTEWTEEYGLTFPVTRDPEVDYVTNELRTARTMQGGIPNFIVLDRQLRIDSQFAGYPDTDVHERVAELIAETE